MNSITLFSPAKINLFFRVLNKREDGYHDIVSLVQCLNFGDTLTFTLNEGSDAFVCNDPSLLWNPTNLIYRAVELFKNKTSLNFSLHVHLDKKIPMQSGLGGGSSNAATALYALNCLMQTQIADSILATWGKELGADVPLFFSLGRALCEGVGDRLTLLPYKKESYWITKPKAYSLATPTVYGQCEVKPHQLLPALFTNDLEEAAFKLLPVLKDFKQKCLDLGFENVVMTGSGTAFICQGDVQNPMLPGTLWIPVQAISRHADSWYAL